MKQGSELKPRNFGSPPIVPRGTPKNHPRKWDLLGLRGWIDGHVTDKSHAEVRRLGLTVLRTYYSKYCIIHEDMVADAIAKMFERSESYDRDRDPPPFKGIYNWMYTFFRNEGRNYIYKEETSCCSRLFTLESYDSKNIINILEDKNNNMHENCDDNENNPSIPLVARKYYGYLNGDQTFNAIEIPKKDVIGLLIWLQSFDKHMDNVPESVKDTPKLTQVLYNLLLKLNK